MYNLAGNPIASNYIKEELKNAGINIIKGLTVPGEVRTNITGQFGRFIFKRAWRYWIVDGPVPLDIANEMYATEIGRRDIRVTGHAGCPPPEEWALPNLDDVLSNEIERLGIESISSNKIRKLCINGEIKTPMFVNLYHIDSQEGLNLFSETIKKHNLI